MFGAVALALVVGAIHRRLPPRVGALSLAATLLLVAVAVVPSVWMLGLGFLGHLPYVGHLLGWCVSAAGMEDPIAPLIGLPAATLCAVGSVRIAQVSTAYRQARRSRPHEVEVTRDEVPVAYTLPGRAGRMVISTGLISMLTADELDVVLAHERAHGAHRHDRMVLLARLSQAAVPALRPLSDRLLFTLERWADEDAVSAANGDRRFVAQTIAKVALRASTPPIALAVGGLGVPARVDALLEPPVPLRSRPALMSIGAAIVMTSALSAYQLHHLTAFASALCPG